MGVMWAELAVTLFLGLAGFAISFSVWRDVRLKVTERRLDAYAQLWEILAACRPGDPPLGDRGRRLLQRRMSDWYYTNGQGMTLGRDSRSLFFKAKDNLVSIDPIKITESGRNRKRQKQMDIRARTESLRRRIDYAGTDEREVAHGRLARRQLSLLRTQLRADLSLFGKPYGDDLNEDDMTFLWSADIPQYWQRPWWPWRRSPWRRWPWQQGSGGDASDFDDPDGAASDLQTRWRDQQMLVERDSAAAGFRVEAADGNPDIAKATLKLVSVGGLTVEGLRGSQGVFDWLDHPWPPPRKPRSEGLRERPLAVNAEERDMSTGP